MKQLLEVIFGREEKLTDMEVRELNRMQLECEKAEIENKLKF